MGLQPAGYAELIGSIWDEMPSPAMMPEKPIDDEILLRRTIWP